MEKDPETEAFLKQYVRYGRFMGVAFSNAVEEFTDLTRQAFRHLTVYTGTVDELNAFADEQGPLGLIVLTIVQMMNKNGRKGKLLRDTAGAGPWDTSYPGEQVDERAWHDYFWFSYDAVLEFLW